MQGPLDRRGHVGLLVVALLLLVSRRPDAVQNPQLWAEDGPLFYLEAYTSGWSSLGNAGGGYLQVLPRLVAALSLPLPLAWIPSVYTAVALLARLLMVHVLLSARCASLIPSVQHRALLALLWIAIPNSWEIHATLTHAARLLAPVCVLVLVVPAASLQWRAFDVALLTATGLSGPWTVLMLPMLLLQRLYGRPSRHQTLCGIAVIATATAQLAIGYAWADLRPRAELGASAIGFARIFGGQVVLETIAGHDTWRRLYEGPWRDVSCVGAAVVGASVFAMAAYRGSKELRLFVCYSLGVVGAAMVFPLHTGPEHAWDIMPTPGAGGRHWIFGALALTVALLTLARERFGRWMAWPLLFSLAWAMLAGWQYTPRDDLHFAAHSRRFAAAMPGEMVIIPIHPRGWTLALEKKSSDSDPRVSLR